MTHLVYPPQIAARASTRDAKLKSLGHKDYAAYLASPAWAKVKAHYRKLVIEACGLCGCESQLDLHHMTYERVGEELPADLVWLCRSCHRMVHVLEKRGDMGLDFAGLEDFQRAARYAAENAARNEQAEAEFSCSRYEHGRDELAIMNIAQQIKTAPQRMSPAKVSELCADIHEILNDLEASIRDGVPYVRKYAD